MSHVFHAQFYGPMAEKGDEIILRDTSIIAAETFFKYIYEDSDFSLLCLNLQDIFDLFYLSEKYFMKSLSWMIRDYIKVMEISEDNVIDIAR